MFELLEALAIATGGMTSLGSLMIILVLLNTPKGPRTSWAYFLGYAGSYAVIGCASLWLGRAVVTSRVSEPSPIGPSMFVALGLLLFVVAIRRWRHPPPADAPPPQFLTKLDGMTPIKALLFGMMVAALNVKNLAIFLSAISVIATVAWTPVEGALAVLLIVAVFCGALPVPLLIYLVFPKRAAQWLASMKTTLETRSDRITAIVLPVVGALLLLKGAWGLYGFFLAV